MVPEKITVEGFLGLARKVELDFTGSDLWLLVGPNGSGKSSVFDAITFALFGRHRGDGRAVQPLLNRRCDRGVVDFVFRLAQDRYRIQRTLKREKDDSVKGDEYKIERECPGGWQIVDDHEEWRMSCLGMDHAAFEASVLLRQGKAETLLARGLGERHKILRDVIGLHEYEDLCKDAGKRLERVRGERASEKKRLEQFPPVPDSQLEAAKTKLTAARKAEDDANARFKEASRAYTLREDLDHEEEGIKKYQTLLERGQEIEGDWKRFQELRLARAWLHQAVSARTKRDEAGTAIKGIEKEAVSVADDLESLAKRLPALSGRHEGDQTELGARVTVLRQRAEEFRDKARERQWKAEERHQKAKDRLDWLRKATPGTPCERCRQPLTAEHITQETETGADELNSTEKDRADAQQARDLADGVCRRADTLPGWHKTAAERLSEAGKTLDQVRQELTSNWHELIDGVSEQDVNDLEKQIREFEKAEVEREWSDLTQATGQLKAHEERAKKLRNQFSELPKEMQAVTITEARNSRTQAERDVELRRPESEKARDAEEKLQQQQKEHEKARREDNRLSAEEREWEELTKHLGRDGLQRYLLRQAEEQVVRLAGETLGRLWPGQTLNLLTPQSEGNLSKLVLDLGEGDLGKGRAVAGGKGTADKVLDLEVCSSSGDRRHVQYLSGSERFRVAISLALAIGGYASLNGRPAQSVIIDEGFGCLDEHNRRGMIDELRRLCQAGVVKRILVVSHQDEFIEGIPDHHRFQQGGDGVTHVERYHG